MFTGASQFAFIGVIGAGGNAWAGAATAALLGSRNALYGLRLSSLLGVSGPRRLLASQLVIDETVEVKRCQGPGDPDRLGSLLSACPLEP